MHSIAGFLRGQLYKPSMEVQARAAFTSLCETYEPDFHLRTIKSLDEDEHMQYLRTMVCLKIASVVPDESNDRSKRCGSSRQAIVMRSEYTVHGTSGNKYNNRVSRQRSADGLLSWRRWRRMSTIAGISRLLSKRH